MIADDEDNVEISLAVEILNGRKCDNTKSQYFRKYEHFRKWMIMKYPECLNHDMTSVNHIMITKEHFLDFLGYICKKKDKLGNFLVPVTYQTFQHVSGYKSAIKDYFSNSGVVLSADIEKMFKEFFGGYQRKIANLRQEGVMSII